LARIRDAKVAWDPKNLLNPGKASSLEEWSPRWIWRILSPFYAPNSGLVFGCNITRKQDNIMDGVK
jgi:hypothetical protein